MTKELIDTQNLDSPEPKRDFIHIFWNKDDGVYDINEAHFVTEEYAKGFLREVGIGAEAYRHEANHPDANASFYKMADDYIHTLDYESGNLMICRWQDYIEDGRREFNEGES